MYECPAGTSAREGSRQCTPCQPGSATTYAGSPFCLSCRSGEYAPAIGSTSCLKCKSKYYTGFGSYSIFYDGTDWYCLPPAATEQPFTAVPSSTAAPSSMPAPWYSVKLSDAPSQYPTSISPSAIVSDGRPPIAPVTSPTRDPASSNAGGKQKKQKSDERRHVFWKFFFPWLAVFAIAIALIAFFAKRVRTRKADRSPRNVPPPTPPPMDSKTPGTSTWGEDESVLDLYLSENALLDSKTTATATVAGDDSDMDLYYDDLSTIEDYSTKY